MAGFNRVFAAAMLQPVSHLSDDEGAAATAKEVTPMKKPAAKAKGVSKDLTPKSESKPLMK